MSQLASREAFGRTIGKIGWIFWWHVSWQQLFAFILSLPRLDWCWSSYRIVKDGWWANIPTLDRGENHVEWWVVANDLDAKSCTRGSIHIRHEVSCSCFVWCRGHAVSFVRLVWNDHLACRWYTVLLDRASVEAGITFWDSSNLYGPPDDPSMGLRIIGKFFKQVGVSFWTHFWRSFPFHTILCSPRICYIYKSTESKSGDESDGES